MTNHTSTPDWSSLPAPIDDGGAKHLPGMPFASIPLPATDGRLIDLSAEPGRVVVYAYPRTGVRTNPIPTDGTRSPVPAAARRNPARSAPSN